MQAIQQDCGNDTDDTLGSAFGTPVRVPPVRAVRSRVAAAAVVTSWSRP
jgi:hypothetical protein